MSDDRSGYPLHILLVEDNLAHAELVMRSFEQHRVANHITHLSDGELAVNYLQRKAVYAERETDLPGLILLDLRLPKIDGLAVLKIIKTDDDLQHIPTVILTTSSAEKDVAEAYQYHANSYLVKPMDYEKLEALVNDLGYYWMVWNKPAP